MACRRQEDLVLRSLEAITGTLQQFLKRCSNRSGDEAWFNCAWDALQDLERAVTYRREGFE